MLHIVLFIIHTVITDAYTSKVSAPWNLQEFPIKSKLDAAKYGDPVSAITAAHIENKLEGLTIDKVYFLSIS